MPVETVLWSVCLLCLAGTIGGFVLSRAMVWKVFLVLFVLSLSAAGLYPPNETLKPGLDLAGGTSLLYDVNVPEGVDARTAVQRTVEVLRDRVDPQGVRNLTWRIERGNRIEVQMPRPNPQIAERRAALEEARQAIAAQNIRMDQVLAVLKADPDARQAGIDQLTKGLEVRRELLQQAAQRYDELQKAEQIYDRTLQDSPQRIALAQEVARAQRAFDQAMDAVAATNIDLAVLGDIVNRPTVNQLNEAGEPIPDSSPRARGLKELKQRIPARADQVEQYVQAYDAYQAVKGPLDDASDLIRLLKGAGVLEFRIAVQPPSIVQRGEGDNVTPQQVEQMREQLTERGPRAGTGDPMGWFPLDDPTMYADERGQLEALESDPQAFFASQGLIGQRYGQEYYILLWNTPEKSMTRRPSQKGWGVSTVRQAVDENYFPAVAFRLNAKGAMLMTDMSRQHVGRAMAIVLDGQVLSAPGIRGTLGGDIQVSGGRSGFSQPFQNYLIQTLQAGSLDARLSEEPISIRDVGSQYGEDNLQAGLSAARTALIVVAIFMILYYFFAGAVADAALLANMVIILGIMAMYQAAFTMPGIAGIVLTIGMCVDANVLVFERIREELNRGIDMATALRLGYGKALSAIIDGNVTNLIVCVILYHTASADVRGFAVTLGIGIGATLFTSLFMTRVIFEVWAYLFSIRKMRMLPLVIPSLERLLSPNIRWIEKRYVFFAISGVAIALSIALCFSRGVDLLDIEFRSGTEVAFELGTEHDSGERIRLPRPVVEERIHEAAEWFADDSDEQALEGEKAELYQTIRTELAGRREVLLEEARIEAERAGELETFDPEQARAGILDATNLAQMRNATVVAVGPIDEQVRASAFSVTTTVSDAPLVGTVIKALFDDVMDVVRPLAFSADDVETIEAAPVYPVTRARLGDVINRTAVGEDVGDYLGGVAIVLDNIREPAPLTDIRQRIRTMRLQPDYEGLQFRDTKVVGVTPLPNDPTRYTTVAVVSRDASLNYFDNPDQWEMLASSEWSLVRDAMQRDPGLSKVSNFTPTVAEAIQQQAIVAILLSFIAIIAYIWFRFGSLRYGLAAVAALAHDVTIAMGFIALSIYLYGAWGENALLIEPYRINLGLIAALLTIIGYSLNDTIIVFDRIRENRGKLAVASVGVINQSINQTISRTLLTSGTTLLAVVILYVLGGPGIREFAFALIIGVGVGTYSSLAVAAPILVIGQPKALVDDSDRSKSSQTLAEPAGTMT
jgi:SecD/SecF fusion protein